MSYAALTHACTLCGSQHHNRSACPWRDHVVTNKIPYLFSKYGGEHTAVLLQPKQGEPNVPGHQHAAAAETPA